MGKKPAMKDYVVRIFIGLSAEREMEIIGLRDRDNIGRGNAEGSIGRGSDDAHGRNSPIWEKVGR